MGVIQLTQGKQTIVDDELVDELSKYKWQYVQGYARRLHVRRPVRTVIWMHREILGTEQGFETDHINGNTLDNRRSNLRQVTKEQNMHNRRVNRNNKVGIKGIWYDKTMSRRKRWVAGFRFEGRSYRVGRFYTIKEAKQAYDAKVVEIRGEYARLQPEGASSSVL